MRTRRKSRDPNASARDSRPLWPASPPPPRTCSRPSSRSTSSCTTTSDSTGDLKNRIAAPTERPDSFIYVSGLSRRVGDLRREPPRDAPRTSRGTCRCAAKQARRERASRRCGAFARIHARGCRVQRRASRERAARPAGAVGALASAGSLASGRRPRRLALGRCRLRAFLGLRLALDLLAFLGLFGLERSGSFGFRSLELAQRDAARRP